MTLIVKIGWGFTVVAQQPFIQGSSRGKVAEGQLNTTGPLRDVGSIDNNDSTGFEQTMQLSQRADRIEKMFDDRSQRNGVEILRRKRQGLFFEIILDNPNLRIISEEVPQLPSPDYRSLG